jgi:hypothetical protein
MVEPVTRDKLIGKFVEFFDRDNKYRIGKVKRITGKRKIWVSVRLVMRRKNMRIPHTCIKNTITKSGLRRNIIWQ